MKLTLPIIVLALTLAATPASSQVLSFGVLDTTQLAVTGEATIEVLYSSVLDIDLFQFSLDISMGVNLVSVSGGASGAAGFTILASPNNGVIGGFGLFSSIPANPGVGVLAVLTVTASLGDQICFDLNATTIEFGFSNGTTASAVGPGATLTLGPCVPVTAPVTATYPGTGDDFTLRTGVNGNPPSGTVDVKTLNGGDLLTVVLESPGTTYDFVPIVLAVELFSTGGASPTGLGGMFAGVHFSPGGPLALIDGTASPLFPQVVLPGGTVYNFLLPPVVPVGFSAMLQSFALDGGVHSANGFFATTNGHEIVFM